MGRRARRTLKSRRAKRPSTLAAAAGRRRDLANCFAGHSMQESPHRPLCNEFGPRLGDRFASTHNVRQDAVQHLSRLCPQRLSRGRRPRRLDALALPSTVPVGGTRDTPALQSSAEGSATTRDRHPYQRPDAGAFVRGRASVSILPEAGAHWEAAFGTSTRSRCTSSAACRRVVPPPGAYSAVCLENVSVDEPGLSLGQPCSWAWYAGR